MIILHASALDGKLVLRGETSTQEPGKAPPRAARSKSSVRPARSRFALEPDRLAEAVAAEVPGLEVSKEQRQSSVAWLPSDEGGALPSSPLLTEEPGDPGAVRIAPWEVPVIALTTEQAIEILAACQGRTTWGPGVVVGKTLTYWGTVLRFAGALVARQQDLPGLSAEEGGTTFRALWEPVLTGEARLDAERLARSMPQGSRPTPYDITIQVKTLSESDWAKVLDAPGRQALFAAKLLAGEMPRDIEPLFEEVGLSLLPARRADLTTHCSCPDSSNPCKHIAAAYYLLGEEFDRDPFLIFALRGLNCDALMTRLEATGPRNVSASESPATSTRPPEPLSAESATFWEGAVGQIEDPCGVVEIPRDP